MKAPLPSSQPPPSSAGGMCPFRHISGEKTVVCKHWLRGLCKKGDQCEFLHEYDMTKMPECYFYSKFGKQTPGLGSPGEASPRPETQRGEAAAGVPALSAVSQLSGFRTLGRAQQPQLALLVRMGVGSGPQLYSLWGAGQGWACSTLSEHCHRETVIIPAAQQVWPAGLLTVVVAFLFCRGSVSCEVQAQRVRNRTQASQPRPTHTSTGTGTGRGHPLSMGAVSHLDQRWEPALLGRL